MFYERGNALNMFVRGPGGTQWVWPTLDENFCQ